MSSRLHECPTCGNDWYCIGCFTQDVQRDCDDCLVAKGFDPETGIMSVQMKMKVESAVDSIEINICTECGDSVGHKRTCSKNYMESEDE